MDVDEADAPVVQTSGFNRVPHLGQLRHPHLRQEVQQRKSVSAVLRRSESKFGDNEWMHQDLTLIKMFAQFSVARTEMVDPNGGIGEN